MTTLHFTPHESFDCYTATEQILHLNVKDYVLKRVYLITFESILLTVFNYDFAFEISTPDDVPFRLKMRSPNWSFEKDYRDCDEAIEVAFAGYRHCVSKLRHDNLSLPAPEVLVVDENGNSIDLELERLEVADRETRLVASKVLTFEGKFIRARIIPARDGSFITTIVHHLGQAQIIADHPFFDPLHATQFVNFYLRFADKILAPKSPEAFQSRALEQILN